MRIEKIGCKDRKDNRPAEIVYEKGKENSKERKDGLFFQGIPQSISLIPCFFKKAFVFEKGFDPKKPR